MNCISCLKKIENIIFTPATLIFSIKKNAQSVSAVCCDQCGFVNSVMTQPLSGESLSLPVHNVGKE